MVNMTTNRDEVLKEYPKLTWEVWVEDSNPKRLPEVPARQMFGFVSKTQALKFITDFGLDNEDVCTLRQTGEFRATEFILISLKPILIVTGRDENGMDSKHTTDGRSDLTGTNGVSGRSDSTVTLY